MTKEFIFKYVLRDFRSYLSILQNRYICEIENYSFDDIDNLDYIYKLDEYVHEITIVKSWLDDYEYKLGLNSKR